MAQTKYGKPFEVTWVANLNAENVDKPFWIAPFPCQVVAVYEIHAVAGTNGSAVNLNLERLQGTEAPAAGDQLLTDNSNAGFDMKGTANTLQTGTLATDTTVELAAGNRLSANYTGTITDLAGVVMTVVLKPI